MVKKKLKDLTNFLLRIGISGGLLWFIFSKIDTRKSWEVLKTADWHFIAYSWLVFIFIFLVLILRWFIFIRALDLKVQPMVALRYYFMGLFGNLFLPSAIGGDMIKIYGLCKNSSQKPRVVASVILDRLSGFAGMAILAIGSFLIGYSLIEEKTLIYPVVFMAIGSLGAVFFLFNQRLYCFACRIFDRLPRFKEALMQMHYDLMLLKDRQLEGVKAIGLSALGQMILAFSFYLIALGLHQKVALVYFFIFIPILCVIASLPSIGGLGVREAGTAYLFTKVGVDSGVAVSMSLINFLFVVSVGLIGGLFYAATHKEAKEKLKEASA